MGKKMSNRGLLQTKSYDDLLRQARRAKKRRTGLLWQLPVLNHFGNSYRDGKMVRNEENPDQLVTFLLLMACANTVFSGFVGVGIRLASNLNISFGDAFLSTSGVTSIIIVTGFTIYNIIKMRRGRAAENIRSDAKLNAFRSDAQALTAFINEEVGRIREELTGESSELGRNGQRVKERLGWARCELARLKAASSADGAYAIDQQLERTLLDIIDKNEAQRHTIEQSVAKFHGTLKEIESRFSGQVHGFMALKTALEINERTDAAEQEIRAAFIAAVAQLKEKLDQLSEQVAKFSHREAAELLQPLAPDGFDRQLALMESGVSKIADTQEATENSVAKLITTA